MYTDLKNVSILIALLKKYEIQHIVISAGTRHIPLVFSVEQDDYFKTYSVVDERSASFFALGMIEKLQKPVAIVCTSGTAACNYVSAVNEAYYQKLPLVVLTADRNQYYMNQQEEQMVMQNNLYGNAVKKSVTLPIVRDEKDAWYCARLVNEALSELDHRDMGPVHINFPVEDNYPMQDGIFSFHTQELPDVCKVNRLTYESSEEVWEQKVKELSKSKVLVFYGQHGPISQQETEEINQFCQMFNCVVSVDLLSNLQCQKSVFTYPINAMLTGDALETIMPDIVITMNGHTVSLLKGKLKSYSKKFHHWNVSLDGEISEPFKNQTDIIECSNRSFFKKFTETAKKIGIQSDDSYYKLWKKVIGEVTSGIDAIECELPFSGIYVAQQFLPRIPQGSLLHLANSNSVRVANSFNVPKDVEVYCNRGTHGIDGSMSAFIGQAALSDGLCFLLIGDLSFFYDMNAFWNRYVGKNIRIIVCNNSGGGIFHAPYYQKGEEFNRIDEHIAAGHETSVKSWAEAAGFKYMVAKDKENLQRCLDTFFEVSDQPILIEALTNMDVDSKAMLSVVSQMKAQNQVSKLASKLPEPAKNTIKKLLKKGK